MLSAENFIQSAMRLISSRQFIFSMENNSQLFILSSSKRNSSNQCSLFLTLVLLKPDIPFANSVDPDQLDLHCLPFSIILINNLDQVM